jgi:glutathione peroxidase
MRSLSSAVGFSEISIAIELIGSVYIRERFGASAETVPFHRAHLAPWNPACYGLIFVILMKLAFLSLLTVTALPVMAADSPVYSVPLKDIDGKDTSLKAYSGKVILAVNVASRCGNTPQYAQLQSLYEKFKDQGLVVVGFPCNDFGAQEPGSNEDVKEFCTKEYKVTFPMMDKVHVKGPEQHPLYKELSGPASPFPGDVKWNFGKFLIDRDGKVAARFEPGVKPDSANVTKAVEAALAKK